MGRSSNSATRLRAAIFCFRSASSCACSNIAGTRPSIRATKPAKTLSFSPMETRETRPARPEQSVYGIISRSIHTVAAMARRSRKLR